GRAARAAAGCPAPITECQLERSRQGGVRGRSAPRERRSAMDGPATAGSATHEVFNQPPPLVGYNLFTSDRALAEAVVREGAGWAIADLTRYDAKLGTPEV